MKNSWHYFFRRLACIGTLSITASWSSAMCYAVQLAYDSAADAAYDNGWQAGDNGGFGFGAWDFAGTSLDGTYNAGPTHNIDNGLKTGSQTSSPHNDLGRSWTIYNPSGRPQDLPNGSSGTDIARAGRSFSPLQVGQTLTVVIDNPIERFFFRGYNVKLNSGVGNVCYGGNACTPGQSPVNMWGVGTFEYFTYGQWGGTSLFDTNTDAGVRISFTLTGPVDYIFTMTPLDNPTGVYTGAGTLPSAAPLSWIEFQFYNTDSDFFPAMVAGAKATDYYIKSIEIAGAAPVGVPGDYNNNGRVDAADYVLWRKGGPLANEVDTPGTVNDADFTAWRARFGNTSGAGSGAWQTSVPEPGPLGLLVVSALGVTTFAFRRMPQTEKE